MVRTQEPETSPQARRQERLEAVVAAFETPLLRYASRLLSFEILRFSILRFCGFAGRRRSKWSFSSRLKNIPFQTGVDTATVARARCVL
jgi:hypothetical protein